MGTQQILMIILSVIVVGSAIAAGIQMFDKMHVNTTKQMMAQELNRLQAMATAWYRTPVAMGGGGNGKNLDGTPRAANLRQIATYLDSSVSGNPAWMIQAGTQAVWYNEIGQFQITWNNQANVGNERIQIACFPHIRNASNGNVQGYIQFSLDGSWVNYAMTGSGSW